MTTNTQLFTLRNQAVKYTGAEAEQIADQLFALLLSRAVTHRGDSSLYVIIESPDPEGYRIDAVDEDRIYVCMDTKSESFRAGVRASRLRKKWMVSAYKIAWKINLAQAHRGAARTKTPSAEELRVLRNRVAVALGISRPHTVFDQPPRVADVRVAAE